MTPRKEAELRACLLRRAANKSSASRKARKLAIEKPHATALAWVARSQQAWAERVREIMSREF